MFFGALCGIALFEDLLLQVAESREAAAVHETMRSLLRRRAVFTQQSRFDEWFSDDELDARVQAVQAQIQELWRRSVVQWPEMARAEAHAGTRKSAAA
jgi:hypothetical protein